MVDEIVRLYTEEGETLSGIEARLGVSRSCAGLWLRRLGIPVARPGGHGPRPARRIPEEIEREVERLYRDEWLSMAEVAERLPIAKQTVRDILARRGVRARPRSWGNRNRNLPQREVAAVVEACVDRGLKAREAAAELGIGVDAVWYRLRVAGVRLRDVRRVR